MDASGTEELADGNLRTGRRIGEGWSDDRYDYRPVRIDSDVSRMTAAVRLAIQAEFAGWELSRVRLYPGGVRKVVLRRRRSQHPLQPEPTF